MKSFLSPLNKERHKQIFQSKITSRENINCCLGINVWDFFNILGSKAFPINSIVLIKHLLRSRLAAACNGMFSKVLGKNIFIVKTNVKLQKNDFIYLIFNVKMSIIYNKQNSALDESNLPTLIIWEVTWLILWKIVR